MNLHWCKLAHTKGDCSSEGINRKIKGKEKELEWQRALWLRINGHWQKGLEKTC